MAYLRSGIDGGRQSGSLIRNRVTEIRGDLATGGKLLLTTTEPTVVDGNELGRIDFQAPLDTAGTDAILVGASIYAEADNTFSSSVNATELVFATAQSGTASEMMRLAQTGRLGIGTSTPGSVLHVAGTVQVGVDDTGYDVIFYGDAAGALMMWDTSEDSLLVRGASADHATDSAGRIVLQTTQTAVADGDMLGRIDFNAPLESSGTDAILVGASIWAEADDTFATDNNRTELVFATAATAAAEEKMRLDYSGQLGIATSSPASLLHVAGTVQVGVDGTGHNVFFYGATAGSYLKWDESNDILELTDSTPIKIGDSQDMTLYHNGTNSYITNKTGSLVIGASVSGVPIVIGHTTSETTVQDNLAVTGTSTFSGTVGGVASNWTGNLDVTVGSHAYIILDSSASIRAAWFFTQQGGAGRWLFGSRETVTSFDFYDLGDTSIAVHLASGGTSWIAGSDERLKKDITSMEDRLDDLMDVKVRRFKWKRNDKAAIGFIAQELVDSVPEAVEVGTDAVWSAEEAEDSATAVEGELKNPWGVSRELLIPMIVKSIQELSVKVKALEDA